MYNTSPINGAIQSIQDISFDNSFTRHLPSDPNLHNDRRQVEKACFSFVQPKSTPKSTAISYSSDMAETLNMSEQFCNSNEFLQLVSGNLQLDGMQPYAMCYGGHQFGNWAGQLGDGRAINLGEVVNSKNERWALQLKGAGPTPYSRTADGFAVLRSSIREYLCSEAMYHLGVPTTRALSLVSTNEDVIRDMFYDGNAVEEPGAIVCRVAPSFLRFGNFEIFSARGDVDNLKRLSDYTIKYFFPEILSTPKQSIEPDHYLEWFDIISQKTLHMVIEWMRVGFVHGVMNTDNMSILGLTIDYGPYGWIDNYDPNWTPNTTDFQNKRYRFGHQALIAQWNLLQLANALYPLIQDAKPLEKIINRFASNYQTAYHAMMLNKLGLTVQQEDKQHQADKQLIQSLHSLLQAVDTDMTLFFRNLAKLDTKNATNLQCMEQYADPLASAFYVDKPTNNIWEQLPQSYKKQLDTWLDRYTTRINVEPTTHSERVRKMNTSNPSVVFRNYIAQNIIDKAYQGDFSLISEFLSALKQPYEEHASYHQKRPTWAQNKPGCSTLSCSS